MFRNAFFILLTLSAIFCLVFVQSNVKPKPQLYFILFSGLTTALFFTRYKMLPVIMYTMLFGALLLLLYYMMFMTWMDFIAPDRATGYLEDGRKVRFMDFTFVFGFFIGIILGGLTLALYIRNRERLVIRPYEKYVSLVIFISTAVGYCTYEL